MDGACRECLNHTANNITVMFGKKASDKLLEKVYHVGCLLENNPFMGAMEPLLAHRTISYRSIVINRLSKLVYRIVEDRIEIADFWDVRREPKALVAQIKE